MGFNFSTIDSSYETDNLAEKICFQDINEQLSVIKGPIQWGIFITNKCNYKCNHCFVRGGILQQKELSDKIFLSMIKQIAELKPLGVCFCGGEPLLRKDLLFKSISIMKSCGINTNFVSNGFLITKKITEALAELDVNLVQISVDGATTNSHDKLRGKKGAHKKALEAVKNLIENEIEASVAFAPTKYNIKEFKMLCNILFEVGVKNIRVQPTMPMGNLQIDKLKILPTENQYRYLVSLIKRFQYEKIYPGMNIVWGDPVDHLIRFSNRYSIPLYLGEITAEGYLGISPYLPLYFGNVNKYTISEYWEAGYISAWEMKISKIMANQIRSVLDMNKIWPKPYYDKPILIDLIENTPEEIKKITHNVVSNIKKRGKTG